MPFRPGVPKNLGPLILAALAGEKGTVDNDSHLSPTPIYKHRTLDKKPALVGK